MPYHKEFEEEENYEWKPFSKMPTEITDEYGKTQIMEVVTEVQDLLLHDRIDTPLTRSDDLPLLEAAVLATRYKVASGEKRQKIRDQIDNILSKIDTEIELVGLLTRFLNS